ncbi:MAG: hypothetical protein C4519_12730 [Desulfobacteraceae bacterium]|nr:MAG: hypothetical protein C4519_12730 [Desulfobacteraceae bacterium]
MIEEWAEALEATGLAGALRGSVWIYPLVNVGHILGVALLVGSIVPLDLRLLGLWPHVPAAQLFRVLTRTAGAGLGLAVACGALLFITRAVEYVQSGLFISKMAVVAVGTANALVLQAALRDGSFPGNSAGFKPAARVRLAAGVSLAAWLTALVLGRLIGYF